MESLRHALLWVAAHQILMAAVAIALGRALLPLVPSVRAWAEKRPWASALAHAATRLGPDVLPVLEMLAKAAFKLVTGQEWRSMGGAK